MFNNPFWNSISTSFSVNFKTALDTAVAQAAVPQAFVKPAPRSQTFTFICFLFLIVARVTLHFSGK